MSEPASLYARLTFDPDAYAAFVASPPARPSAFADWQAWFDRHRLAGDGRIPDDGAEALDGVSVAQVLDAWQRDATLGMPPVAYDAASGVCRITMLSASENFEDFLRLLAPLRGAAAWTRPDADDFIVILDFLWGGDQTSAYVALGDSRSRLLDTVPAAHRAEAMAFLDETLAAFEQQG